MNYLVADDLIDEFCQENKVYGDDIEVYMFPQMWSSTALGFDGFDGFAGQAITKAQTTVLWSEYRSIAWVAFAGRLAYKIDKPNTVFFLDVYGRNMKGQSKAGSYQRNGLQ